MPKTFGAYCNGKNSKNSRDAEMETIKKNTFCNIWKMNTKLSNKRTILIAKDGILQRQVAE